MLSQWSWLLTKTTLSAIWMYLIVGFSLIILKVDFSVKGLSTVVVFTEIDRVSESCLPIRLDMYFADSIISTFNWLLFKQTASMFAFVTGLLFMKTQENPPAAKQIKSDRDRSNFFICSTLENKNRDNHPTIPIIFLSNRLKPNL